MYPADHTQDLEVSIEWDKNERQRARNRINQRNYRTPSTRLAVGKLTTSL